jgi:predicted Holliday junction resolvase-like endonuclease
MEYVIILALIIFIGAIAGQLLRTRPQLVPDRVEAQNMALKTELAVISDRHRRELKDLEIKIKSEYESWMQVREKHIRKDAVEKSKSVIRGQTAEHFAPFMMDSDLDPKDFRFFAAPIDFVVFDGMAKVREGVAQDIEQIIFLDVKTGSSSLSKVQQAIKRAVDAGRVNFSVFNPDEDAK